MKINPSRCTSYFCFFILGKMDESITFFHGTFFKLTELIS
jgi:hypothetical protein